MTTYINGVLYRVFASVKDYRILGLLKELWKFLNPNALEANQNYYIQLADYTDKDIIRNRELLDSWQRGDKSIAGMTWFIPMFYMVAAGVNNIFRFILFLSGKGVQINIVLMGTSVHAERCIRLINDMTENQGQIKIFVNPSIAGLPYADAGVATMWYTAYGLLKYNNTKGCLLYTSPSPRDS